ncbi:hypothetical protein ACIHCV_07915 [Streptomyces sp. NPDC051956]|uniref:hypothetical protein n=1 Tax=Streptomyces sp. NPDC051956 TaxID=3365677 RepID=UPI0037D0AB23
MSEITRDLSSFSAAPFGWRVAIADTKGKELIVVHVVGWGRFTDAGPYSHTGDGELDPLILWNNVGEPFVSSLSRTLSDWTTGEDEKRYHVHEILPPGSEPRQVPEGWAINVDGNEE